MGFANGILKIDRPWVGDGLESFQIVHPFIVGGLLVQLVHSTLLSASAELTMEDRSFQGWHHHRR